MPFLAVGIEHRTAPVSIRERVSMEEDAAAQACSELVRSPFIAEAAVLSTCNRTEVYLFADEEKLSVEAVSAYLGGGNDEILRHLQIWQEMDAVEHLFRVACGLESQLLGEAQILSQVRGAFEAGQRTGAIGANLHSLFRSAISCAKQARAGTALGRVNLSLASEAVGAAEDALGTLEGRSVLLIGGGEIGRLAAEELRRRKLGSLFIVNRTVSVAKELADRHGGRPAQLTDIPLLLPRVDVVITATSGHQYILTPENVPPGVLEAREAPLHVFDLAIPRDVDPALGSISGIVLHDLESLLPSGTAAQWDGDIRAMEGIIAAEVKEFMAWHLTRRVVPVIANLRSHVEAVQEQELRRVAPQLSNLTERERAAVESLTSRLIDKMFHHLVMRLRLAAQTDPGLVDAAEFFFLHGEGALFPHAAEMQTSDPCAPHTTGDRDHPLGELTTDQPSGEQQHPAGRSTSTRRGE